MQRDLRRRLAVAGVAVIYGLALVLPFRVFWPRFATHLIGDRGDALLQHLHCAWQWRALAEGRWRELLSLPTLYPFPTGFAFGEPLVGICLPLAPVFALTGSSAAAYNSAVVASFALLALAIFVWSRDLFASAPAGLLAATLVAFDAWRLHYLSALNVLSIHYAVFGLWLLGRWLARGRFAALLGAALLFHVQLVSAAQGAIVAGYVAGVWCLVVWAGSGFAWSRRRSLHGGLALAALLAVSLPWLSFFEPAFAARSGLRNSAELRAYSATFAEMAREFGILGWRGALAAAGAIALAIAARRGRFPRSRALDLAGIGLGAGVLFVLARGPWTGTNSAPVRLPAYYAEQVLPGLDLLRAPIRLAAFTPLALALCGAGALAALERAVATHRRIPAALRYLLPLAACAAWPALEPSMGAPIAERPRDRALAERLAELPRDAVILPLPLALSDRHGAAVDERVSIHRRPQIGGFASIIPGLFVRAAYALGSWPREGSEIARALGATHVVAPESFGRDAEILEREGIRALWSLAGQTLFELAPRPARSDPDRVDVPSLAAADRWLTAALFPGSERFDPRGAFELGARWTAPDGREEEVGAFAFVDSVIGPRDPIRILVPTPARVGTYPLAIDLPGSAIAATVEVASVATSFDAPVEDVRVALAPGAPRPQRARAGAAFRIEVEIDAPRGPILLATSRWKLPPRRGELAVWYGFRNRAGQVTARRALERSALGADLVPGSRQRVSWSFQTPAQPGRYDLIVSLESVGIGAGPEHWVPLLTGLEVARD
jgi:hypothetical protein